MDLLGLENTPAAAMGHDQVLGAPHDTARALLMKNISFGFERIVGVPGCRSNHRHTDDDVKEGTSGTVEARPLWGRWR